MSDGPGSVRELRRKLRSYSHRLKTERMILHSQLNDLTVLELTYGTLASGSQRRDLHLVSIGILNGKTKLFQALHYVKTIEDQIARYEESL
jgi:hypothetical protein